MNLVLLDRSDIAVHCCPIALFLLLLMLLPLRIIWSVRCRWLSRACGTKRWIECEPWIP